MCPATTKRFCPPGLIRSSQQLHFRRRSLTLGEFRKLGEVASLLISVHMHTHTHTCVHTWGCMYGELCFLSPTAMYLYGCPLSSSEKLSSDLIFHFYRPSPASVSIRKSLKVFATQSPGLRESGPGVLCGGL